MDIRYGAHPRDTSHYDTEALRKEFLIDGLFTPGSLNLTYSHADRMIVGSAVPAKSPIKLEAQDELRAAFFLERREIGIINIGGGGSVKADGTVHMLAKGDGLYLGRGTTEVEFRSDDPTVPAQFYFNSCPAHTAYPNRKVSLAEASPNSLGSLAESNKRTIYKYFHENGVKSCQLVMGMTMLEPGSVWNTMPCHTHERRMETYLYFDIAEGGVVFHFMGKPDQTRHLVMRDRQAVISPSWSIHSGCGTRNYTFIWSMAGENQAFADMDAVKSEDLY